MPGPAKKKAVKPSGIRKLNPNEVLFHEKDVAGSLYIIQAGQIRLFRPKGKGYVDLAILRAGEVIGEMAYFADKDSRRSCSAAAMTSTEIIEISFKAFDKALHQLNPWFKTIIKTLVERLRRTNEQVKNLENESVGRGKDGMAGTYEFFKETDIIRLLVHFYSMFKSQGEQQEGGWFLNKKRLQFYMLDIFASNEIKFEEFINLMSMEGFLEVAQDEAGQPNKLFIPDIELWKTLYMFFQNQKTLEEKQKIKISTKCERILSRALEQCKGKPKEKNGKVLANVSEILDYYKERRIPIDQSDLEDAVKTGLCEDILIGSGGVITSMVDIDTLAKIFPAIQLKNAVFKLNESKDEGSKYS